MNTLFCECTSLPESCEPKQVFAGKLHYWSLCPSLVGPTWTAMGCRGDLEASERGGLQLSAGFPMGRRLLWSLGLFVRGFPSGARWLVQPSLPGGHVPELLGFPRLKEAPRKAGSLLGFLCCKERTGLQLAVFGVFFSLSALFQFSVEVWYLGGWEEKPSGCIFLRTQAPRNSDLHAADPHAARPGCAEHRAARMCQDARLEPGQPPTCALGFLGTGVCMMGEDKPGAFLVSERFVGSWAPCEGRR